MMNRRGFLGILGARLLAASVAAEAQPAAKTYRIGWLAPAPIPDNLDAFRGELRALGYVEGHNVTIGPRYAVGQSSLAATAVDLLRINPDVIVTDGSSAALAPVAPGKSDLCGRSQSRLSKSIEHPGQNRSRRPSRY